MSRARTLLVVGLLAPVAHAAPVESLDAPPGFRIDVVTEQVPSARQMALGASGTLFVGTMREGALYAIPDRLAAKPTVIVLARNLPRPSGVAVAGGDLYVGASRQILRFSDIEARLDDPPQPELITDALPDSRQHRTKYLRFGADGRLYLPIGAPCNACTRADERIASIVALDVTTGATEVVARGVRSSVGFDWHPETGELWFTDNGRDMLGDDVPADEINRLVRRGDHFGFPFIHGGDLPDPDLGWGHAPSDYVAPVVRIQAHSAPVGAAFYTGEQFPARYRGALLVAEHGSWNRSRKVGYQVSVMRFVDAGVVYEPFVTGWLQGERAWGRPADVLVEPEGSVLISDDRLGAIYRVSYRPD